jgi:transcription initiation factor TFIIB
MGMAQPQNEAWSNSEIGTRSTGRDVDARTDSHAEIDRSPRATIRTCPECDSTDVRRVPTRGEIVCASCGLVVETDELDRGPEWRAFSHDERQQKARVGAPTTPALHDKGLTTTIGWQNTDGYGNEIGSAGRDRVQRLRKWQTRIRTSEASERSRSP